MSYSENFHFCNSTIDFVTEKRKLNSKNFKSYFFSPNEAFWHNLVPTKNCDQQREPLL